MHDNSISSLLEALVAEAKCSYISDLHNPLCRNQVKLALDRVPAEAYSADVWRQVYRYLALSDTDLVAAQDVREALIRFMSNDTI